MSIVAIAQTMGSVGDEIGRELARALGYEFADREIILQAAERFGEGVMDLEHVTEERPSLTERFTQTRQRYLAYVAAIILEMAARDNVILAGRAATFVLKGVRHALRVRITAPERVRVNRVESQQGLTSQGAADLVRDNDGDRAARVRFLYHVDWDDPLLYDLVVNTEHLDVGAASRVIREVLLTERFQPTPDSLADVKDRSLIAYAKAALVAQPKTRAVQVSLTCQGSYLTVSGMVDREELRKAVEEILGRIPGIAGLRSDLQVAPRQHPRT